ncbi:MAG: class I SAM-dependent methyltransferase, partial [Dolichospermum sp.]
MYKTRRDTKNSPELFWGIDTQPERLNAVLKYTSNNFNILDLGCGRGAYTETLNRKGFKTTGIDAYEYPEWETKPDDWFIQTPASSLPFEDKKFDMTISFEVLEHCSEPTKVLEEVARVTSKYFILSVPNCDLNNTLRNHDLAMAHWTDPTHCNFFTKETIVALLQEHKFKILEISDCYKISPNNYFWDSVKLPKKLTNFAKKVF